MKLTIAQFTSSLHLAGQERVVVDLAGAFQEKGHTSLVCTTKVGGELVKELEASSLPFQCLSLESAYDPRSLMKVMRYLRDNKVDVVITHGNYRFVARMAAILSRASAVIHVEHNVSDYKRFYHVLANRALTLFTDRIICISGNAEQSLMKVEKPPLGKVVVIPNGLNTKRFGDNGDIGERDADTKRIGIVGRFTEQKGHCYFVEAAAKIVRACKGVRFIFVGDGPLRAMIERKVAAEGLEECCDFLGVRSDVDALLRSFDVFVLSSLWEGLPISLLEAQYFGVASVVTDVGGNSEVVRHGHNGLLVASQDPDDLASAILRLLNDEKLRNDMGSRAKEVFREKFSVDQMANRYMELICEVIEGKKKTAKKVTVS